MEAGVLFFVSVLRVWLSFAGRDRCQVTGVGKRRRFWTREMSKNEGRAGEEGPHLARPVSASLDASCSSETAPGKRVRSLKDAAVEGGAGGAICAE